MLFRSSINQAIDPRVPIRLTFDVGRLRQVLINVIGNAVKFSAAGSIAVRASMLQDTVDGGVRVQFEVDDNGPGIDARTAARLFEPFQQGHAVSDGNSGGSGLGLAICRRLLTMMGGDIELAQSSSTGSTFRFSIVGQRSIGQYDAGQQDEQAALQTSTKALLARSGGRTLRTLLVEDHATMRDLTVEVLQRLGCDVRGTGEAEAAVELARSEQFDIILMDCQLPGMSGLDATRAIRATEARRGTQPVPIIALTANAFSVDRTACRSAGMTDFLGKPFSVEQLADMVEKYASLPARALDRTG